MFITLLRLLWSCGSRQCGSRTMPTIEELPAGCRMPAEWELHEATWIAWPHNQDDWPGKFDAIPWVYGEIIRPLCRSERVFLLVPPASTAHLDVLEELGLDRRVSVVELPTD